MVVALPPADLDFEHLQRRRAAPRWRRSSTTGASEYGYAKIQGTQAADDRLRARRLARRAWRRGSSRSSGRGATATATSSAASPRTSCSTTSCCTGSPAPPTRPGASTTRPSTRRVHASPNGAVEVPVGVAAFPKEIIRSPRSLGGAPVQHRPLDRHAARRPFRGVRSSPSCWSTTCGSFFRRCDPRPLTGHSGRLRSRRHDGRSACGWYDDSAAAVATP